MNRTCLLLSPVPEKQQHQKKEELQIFVSFTLRCRTFHPDA